MHMRSFLSKAGLTASLGLAFALTAGVAHAAEVRGINFPETKQAEGQQLRLNGAGDRSMLGMATYAAGLYVENPTTNAQQLIQSDQVKRLELHMLRDLSKQQFGDALTRGMRANTTQQEFQQLQPKLNDLVSALPDFKKGQVVNITFRPDQVTVEAPGIQPKTVQGQDFSRAALEIWLGENPAQQSLKRELLRGAEQPRASMR